MGQPTFPSFSDWMEAQEPGWKARQAEAAAKRRQDEDSERASIIAKYGSENAVTEPNELEAVLDTAVSHLKRKEVKEFINGRFEMETLDGWDGEYGDIPSSVLEAVSSAFPLPSSIAGAMSERDYWRSRDRELILLLDCEADTCLSLAASARLEVVTRLFLGGIPARNVAEVIMRMEDALRFDVVDENTVRTAVRDLKAMQGPGSRAG